MDHNLVKLLKRLMIPKSFWMITSAVVMCVGVFVCVFSACESFIFSILPLLTCNPVGRNKEVAR